MNGNGLPQRFHKWRAFAMSRHLLYMAIAMFCINCLFGCARQTDSAAERVIFVAKNNIGEKKLYIMNLDGRGPNELHWGGFEQISKLPAWSTDGKRAVAYLDRNDASGLYISDDETKVPRLVLSDEDLPRGITLNGSSYPILSPDGSALAFLGFGDSGAEVFIANIAGTSVTQLTRNEFSEEHLSWSPDGKRLVFASALKDMGGYLMNDIFVIGADGSGIVQLTNNASANLDPSWSPDGKRIVFTRDRDIYVLELDTMNETRLTDDGLDMRPVWSPAGDRIAFISLRDSECDGITIADGVQFCTTAIYFMDADGSNSVLWLKDNKQIVDIAWLPLAGSVDQP